MSLLISKPQDSVSCLAIYDWEPPLVQAVWLALVLDFFQKLRIEPNLAVCGAGGKWSKPIKLSTLQSRVERGNLFEFIELYLLPENYQTMLDATAGVLFEDTGVAPQGKRSMIFTVPGNLDSNKEKLYELCKSIAQHCEPSYGIGYELNKACGPINYGLGIIQSSKDCQLEPLEEEKIAIWFRERIGSRDAGPKNRHLLGKIRDVYRLNILSGVHLSTSVHGMTLKEWILADSRRGILEKLGSKSSLWEIPTVAVGEIRKYLSREGLLICDQEMVDVR